MTNIVKNKNGIEFDIDAIATDLNGKMDRDGVNATCPVVVSRTPNSQGGVVEIWSDGYCVQSGYNSNSSATITLDKPYIDTNYIVFTSILTNSPGTNYYATKISNKTTTNFLMTGNSIGNFWKAEGYIR